jgi:hypothetical protein
MQDYQLTGPTTDTETLASDALERIARLLGVAVDLDDPEPALFAAVEKAVTLLVTGLEGAKERFTNVAMAVRPRADEDSVG